MRKGKLNFKKKTVAFLTALSLAVQPFAGSVFNTSIVAEAAAADVVSIAKYDAQSKTTILKEEDGTFRFVMPRINGEPLSENGFEQYKDSFSILVKLEDDVDFVPIDKKLTNVRNEAALQAADDEAYYTQYWVDKDEENKVIWSGWGMRLKLSDEVAFVRFQSNAYEDIYLDYKLQEVGKIDKVEFKDVDGDDQIQIGIGQTVVINFDFLQLNDGKLGAGEYGYENFEWKALVGGELKSLDDVFTWEQNYGWDSYPENGGYYFNPIKENITFRAIYKENPAVFADYKVEIITGTKGPEYNPNNPDQAGDTPDPGKNKNGYKLIWYDEFDGQYGSDQVDPNTGLDLNKWSYQLGNGVTESGGDPNMAGWGNGERQSYTNNKKNIAVNENGKGLLRITASYEDEGVNIKGEDKSYYSSGRIVTRGDDPSNPLFNTTYGYVESRMALPETVGAWPAFWMLPQSTKLYGAWPLSGEIDIMESCGNLKNQACATLHWGTPEHVYQGSGYVDLNSTFSHMHTYAVEWEPGKITFYYDGKKIYTQASWGIKSDLGAADSVTFDAPYDQPYYLLLNLALDSGNFGGKDNMTTFRDDINMYVDYVRVYQKENGYDTTGIRRQVLDAKTDWKDVAGNKISPIKSDNIVEAEDGNVNALEILGTDDKAKWYLAYTEGGSATVEPFVKNNTDWAKVNVKNDGTQSYSVQLIGHYNAQAGYLYKVSFDAYAEGGLVGKTANADSKEYKGWSTYGSTSFVLADEPRTYSFFVDQKADFDDCRVEFNFGNLGEKMSEIISGAAYVGNVKVEIVDPEDIGKDLVRYPQPLVDGEVIYNGSFDQGVNHAGFWSAGEGTHFNVPDYTTESLTGNDIAIKDVAAGVTKYYERRAQVSAENGKPSIYQAGFALDKSKYTAVFDVYSEKATTVNAAIYSVDTAEDGTQKLGTKLLESSTQNVAANKVVTYACDFEPLRALQNAALVLTFGEGASVQVDNVSLLPANKARQVHPEIEDGTAQNITKDVGSLIRINYVMHDNDAVNPDSNPFYFEKGEGTIQLAPATSPNAEFAGWSEKEKAQYVEDYVTEVSTNRDSLTLHAQWGERVTDSNKPETPEIPEEPETSEEPKDTTVAVTGVTLNKTKVSIIKGETLQLIATIDPEDATNQNIKWESSDPDIVSVDENGLITALNTTNDFVVITAKTEDGTQKDSCLVTVTEEAISVTGVKIVPDTVTLGLGESKTLTAIVEPENATNQDLEWHSSQPACVTVDGGVIQASNIIPNEPVKITVTTKDGNFEATCEVNVVKEPVAVTGISLKDTEIELTEGESRQLVASVVPEDAANQNVTWKLKEEADSEYASVDNEGNVTALKAGKVTVIAVSEEGSYEAECVVTINAKVVAVTGISLKDTEIELTEGESRQLVASVTPEDATNQNVTWKLKDTADSEFANIDREGKVTAWKAGKATVIAVSEDGAYEAECIVTINAKVVAVTGISLKDTEIELTEGESRQLVASVTPEDATNQNVTWKLKEAADSEYVSVDSEGNVTALKAGKATVIAISEDGSYLAECIVTVNAKVIAVTGISLAEPGIELTEGESRQLVATIAPENATNQNVTWKLKEAADSEYASVDSEGNVTALKEGKATVIAVSEDGAFEAECIVTINAKVVAVTGISLEEPKIELTEGESRQLVATIVPEDATNQNVTWKLKEEADSEYASVDSEGNVTALKEGKATVIAVSEDGAFEAECIVTINAKVVAVTGISLEEPEIELTEGESRQLVATIVPEDATNQNVTWKLKEEADSEYASVDSEGNVTALKEGKATVIAVSEDGSFEAECIVTINAKVVAVTGISLTEPEIVLLEGDRRQLVATIVPEDATNKNVIWKMKDIADSEFANIDSEGNLTAWRAGQATVVAVSEDGSYEAECIVTIYAKEEPIIPVGDYMVTFNSNGGTPVEAQFVAPGRTVVYPQIPTRDCYTFAGWTLDGVVYDFNMPVNRNITLTAQWNEIKATGVKITGKTKYVNVGTSAKIAVGKKITLVATVSPENVTNSTVTWKSSNTKYATVNQKGVVTAKKAGKNKTVKITATTTDGSNKKKTFKIKIMPKAVKKITLTQSAKKIKAGKSVTIKATVTPSNKKQVNTTLKWVSSNTKYATVSKKGVVKTKKAGKGKTVKITAYSTDGSNKKKTVKIKITK